MPDTVVVGAGSYKPTPQQVARIKSFLQTVPVKNIPDTIVVLPKENFHNTIKKAMSGAGDTDWAVSNVPGKRIYINSAVFDEKHPNSHYQGQQFPEFVLAHELSHFNDKDNPATQETQEIMATKAGKPNPFDLRGQDLLSKWAKQNGPVYSELQQQVATAQGQTQPVSAPIATALRQPTNEFSNIPYSAARAARLQ